MLMMSRRSGLRRRRNGMAWRLGASLLIALHLALALAAARHAETHTSYGLAWLPPAFHQHSYHLTAVLDGALAPVADPCLACATGRLPFALAAPTLDLPILPTLALVPGGPPPFGSARDRDPSHAPRGPPLG